MDGDERVLKMLVFNSYCFAQLPLSCSIAIVFTDCRAASA